MDIDERRKTALEAGYCLRCFAPRTFVKTEMDLTKHHEDRCYVKSTNKHRFTCLNEACLQHSWICYDYTEENRPLLEAHHKLYPSPRLPTTGTPLDLQGE